jgi:septal ring factor EnvC (AmiA/AmiB activator)
MKILYQNGVKKMGMTEIIGIVGFFLGLLGTILAGVATLKKTNIDAKSQEKKDNVDVAAKLEAIWTSTMDSLKSTADNLATRVTALEEKLVTKDRELYDLKDKLEQSNRRNDNLTYQNNDLREKMKVQDEKINVQDTCLRKLIDIVERSGISTQFKSELDEIKNCMEMI